MQRPIRCCPKLPRHLPLRIVYKSSLLDRSWGRCSRRRDWYENQGEVGSEQYELRVGLGCPPHFAVGKSSMGRTTPHSRCLHSTRCPGSHKNASQWTLYCNDWETLCWSTSWNHQDPFEQLPVHRWGNITHTNKSHNHPCTEKVCCPSRLISEVAHHQRTSLALKLLNQHRAQALLGLVPYFPFSLSFYFFWIWRRQSWVSLFWPC